MIEIDRHPIVDDIAVSIAMIFGVGGGALALFGGRVFPLLFAALITVVLLPWYVSYRRGRIDIFEPIVFHSVFVGMVVIALFERVYLRDWYWRYDVIGYEYRTGLLLFALVYLGLFSCILVGYYGPFGRRLERSIREIRSLFPTRSEYPVRSIRGLAIGYAAVGAIFYIILIYSVLPDGNPLYLFEGTTPRSEVLAGNHLIVAGMNLLYVGYFLWLTATIAKGIFPRPYELAPLPVLMGLFFLLGGRGRMFGILLIAVVLLYYAWTADLATEENWLASVVDFLPTAVTIVVTSLLAIGTLTFGVAFRWLRQGLTLREAGGNVDFVSILTLGIHNDKIDNFLALTEVVPEDVGFFYGTFYVRAITNFVPRALWEDKPVLSVGSLLRRAILPDAAGGRAVGQIGDYYVNFGFPGILVMGFIFGIVLRLLYVGLRTNRSSPLAVLLYALLLVFVAKPGITTSALFTTTLHLLILLPVFLLIVSRDSRSPVMSRRLVHRAVKTMFFP